MTVNEKAEALIKVAKEYVARGKCIQYDQRCMDRSLFLTPRRIKLIPPEAATPQNTVYLDCSSYVGALFYETFGYELRADLTWHMVDEVGPRVYYYEFTHEETEEEKARIISDIKSVLLPADVITYDRGVGSGHTMLYIGDGLYTHCTSAGPDSYDFVNRRSREYDAGGLSIVELSTLFTERRLFNPKIRRIAVARPILKVADPTEKTKKRLSSVDGLYLEVLTSHPGRVNAEYDEDIIYTLRARETKNAKHSLKVNISLPNSAILLDDAEKVLELLPGESAEITFKIRAVSDSVSLISGVDISVNGFSVFVPNVLLGKRLTKEVEDKISSAFKYGDIDAFSLAKEVYAEMGIELCENEKDVFQTLFYLHDAPTGDVLSRRLQNPQLDGAVYSFFGGTGVVTPEMISNPFIRTNQIRKEDFLVGDIILISDDALANRAYASLYTGDALVGKTDFDAPPTVLSGKAMREFFDSLLGRFAFVVLRPALKG